MKHPLPSESAALVFSDWSSLTIICPAPSATCLSPLWNRPLSCAFSYDGNRARPLLQLAARAREQKMPTSFNRLNGRNYG